jgi:hypothetical protein
MQASVEYVPMVFAQRAETVEVSEWGKCPFDDVSAIIGLECYWPRWPISPDVYDAAVAVSWSRLESEGKHRAEKLFNVTTGCRLLVPKKEVLSFQAELESG